MHTQHILVYIHYPLCISLTNSTELVVRISGHFLIIFLLEVDAPIISAIVYRYA